LIDKLSLVGKKRGGNDGDIFPLKRKTSPNQKNKELQRFERELDLFWNFL